ncbi:uncharacterized protein C8A04DRAFT_24625 [Dichotomopilus funicola]|uniref:Uncharacterized protein n=1 Tax=Dichotomopilus funicola TaxID=1934379 RepID=A0AAN6ZRA6_9PEZI|nr:hypothetical protein C8A04DRAFT_24625 [Dichotomopilus funicola]
MTRQTTLTLLLTSLLTTQTQADPKILTCADVECPIVPNTTSANCTVLGTEYTAIGILPLDPLPPDAITDRQTAETTLQGLSWTKAVGTDDFSREERRFRQGFFLGTPPEFDSLVDGTKTDACALLFTQVAPIVRLDKGGSSHVAPQGTCSDALSSECVAALTRRAEGVDLAGLAGQEACDKLRGEFVGGGEAGGGLDEECARFVTGDQQRWTGVRARALVGEGAVEAVGAGENGTTNCWPVWPREDGLRVVGEVETTGDYDATTLQRNLLGATPILTVFYPVNSNKGNGNGNNENNGNNGLVSRATAQLTCVQVSDLTTASNETMVPGEHDDNGDSSAIRMMGGSQVAMWGALMAVVFVFWG